MMVLYDDEDLLAQAVEAGKKALSRAKNDTGLQSELGRILRDMGNITEASKFTPSLLQ